MCKCKCSCDSGHKKNLNKKYGFRYHRRFLTKAEKIENLEKYAEELVKEKSAVEEHIKELKN